MNNTTIYQETTITIHEEGRSQTLMHVLHLRIREGKPYLLHLIFAKETVDNLNAGTQESYIIQPFFQSLFSTCIDTSTLDINANKVDIRVNTCQTNSIFTLTTSQLKYNRVIVMEILFTPMPSHFKRNFTDNAIRILENVLKRFHLCKFL